MWDAADENEIILDKRDEMQETGFRDLAMNSAGEKNQIEKSLESDDGEILNGLEYLAKAATNVQNESLDERFSVTSTPSKKYCENMAKRPKTIREIYDEEQKVNEDCIVVNCVNKVDKKNVNKSGKKTNRTYFYDFYQDIKNDVEDNEKEFPST